MPAGKRIPREIKEQILRRIKDEGITATQAAKEHGVHLKTVYGWLGGTTRKINPLLEINKLKRENKELYELIGKVTVELQNQKKLA